MKKKILILGLLALSILVIIVVVEILPGRSTPRADQEAILQAPASQSQPPSPEPQELTTVPFKEPQAKPSMLTGQLLDLDDDSPWTRLTRVYIFKLPEDFPNPKKAFEMAPQKILKTTRGSFSVKVSPGHYQVRCESVTPGLTISGAPTAALVKPHEKTSVTIRLGGRTRIVGEVRFDDGRRGPANAHVILVPRMGMMAKALAQATEAWTDAEGRFALLLPYRMPSGHEVGLRLLLPRKLRKQTLIEQPAKRQPWDQPFLFTLHALASMELADHVEIDYAGPELALRWTPPAKLPRPTSSHPRQRKQGSQETEDEVVVPGQAQPNASYRLLLKDRVVASERPFVLRVGLNKIALKPSLKEQGYRLLLRSSLGTLSVPLVRRDKIFLGKASAWVQGYRVFGNIAGPVQGGDQVYLQRQDRPGISIWSSTKLDPAGSFLFEGVPPGVWYLGLHRQNTFFMLDKSFNTRIEVKDHDVDLNLEARLPPP